MTVTVMMVMLMMINLSFELYSRLFLLLETPPTNPYLVPLVD